MISGVGGGGGGGGGLVSVVPVERRSAAVRLLRPEHWHENHDDT